MEVTTQKFNKDHHTPILKGWALSRNLEDDILSMLPENGYVVYVDKEPVAAAFLRIAEAGVGIVDGIIADPYSPHRDKAVPIAIQKVVNLAKELNLKGVLGWSNHKGILKRSKSLGYSITSTKLIYKKL